MVAKFQLASRAFMWYTCPKWSANSLNPLRAILLFKLGGNIMDEEKDEIREEENENSSDNDNREEETSDEIRDTDYVNDDEIEMDRSLEEKIDKVLGKLDSLYDTISMFVDSGAVIRETNPNDIAEENDDFAEEFLSIDELDWSLD